MSQKIQIKQTRNGFILKNFSPMGTPFTEIYRTFEEAVNALADHFGIISYRTYTEQLIEDYKENLENSLNRPSI